MMERYFAWCICLAALSFSGRTAEVRQTEESKQDPAKSSRRLVPHYSNGKWGYIDAVGKVAITPQFDEVGEFHLGRARARLGDKWGYIDTTGAWVAKPQFTEVEDFDSWRGWAEAKLGNTWGYVDKAGEWNFEPQEETGELRAEVCCNEVNYIWGSYAIDTTKTLISFDSQFQGDFFDGLVKVRVKGKWGYVDTTGKIVIAPEYYGAGDFSEDRAPVLIGPDQEIANIRYIDHTGKIVSTWEVDTTAVQSEVVSEIFYKTGERLHVLASSGIKLREAPNSNAKILAIAAYGDQVEVSEDQVGAARFKIDGMKGRWVLAKYGEITGYVFDGFISRLPAPPENCYGLDQYVMEKLLGTGKREMIHINPDDSGGHAALEVQKCRYGVIWEFHHGWEGGSQTLIIPNIRLEEGTLIADLCTRKWLKDSIETVDISVKKNEKSQVEITVRWEL